MEGEADELEELGYVEQAATLGTWCANEGQRCQFTGTRQVRYGSSFRAITRTFTDGVDCTNAAIGDPATRYAKSCWFGPRLDGPSDGGSAPDARVADATVADTGVSGSDAAPSPADAGTAAPSASTPQLCSSPLGPANTSSPTAVVGTGTAASCSEQSLREAVARGGIITFNCGSAVTTIAITQTLNAPWDRDTTIDGNDRIVLDGRGTTQILRAHSANFRANDRVLTVQRLAMIGGRDVGTNFVARDGTKTCAFGYKSGGGGAIAARDVNVKIWGVRFEDNRGPELGPDVAGGAIYVMGAKKLIVANSIFRNNSASNGGGIGALHTSSELYNVVLEQNRATGTLANFANATGCPTFNHEAQGGAGGLGGAFYSDGFDSGDTFCGVRMANNSAGDLGGAVFRSAYWGLLPDVAKQTITWERSTFEGNRTPVSGGGAAYVNNSLFVLKSVSFIGNDSGTGDGGGMKITGLTVRADDVQFTNNKASWGGGVAHWGAGPEGAGSITNVRFSGNTPNDFVGDFPR